MNFDQTEQEYLQIIVLCKELFEKKTKDYGTAWRILRLPSITDQIFIKAQRIRSIQEKGIQKVEDGIRSEFIGIVNYSLIALIQHEIEPNVGLELETNFVIELYNKKIEEALVLLRNKNHDYGEAWREMRITSMTDLILMKLLRIKQIEDNQGKTLASEGVVANYQDILNYAVFCLILSQNK
jgi:Nucleotide modification associated domain 1